MNQKQLKQLPNIKEKDNKHFPNQQKLSGTLHRHRHLHYKTVTNDHDAKLGLQLCYST